MFFRMIRRSFLEARRRKVIAIMTVALAASLITTLLDLSVDVGDKMAKELKAYGSNISIVPKSESIPLKIGGIDFNPLKGRDYLREKNLANIKDIFWSNNIVGFTPFLQVPVELKGQDTRLPLIGTYFDKSFPLPSDELYRTGATLTHPYWDVSGAWPDDESANEVLVGKSLARRLDLAVGNELPLVAAERDEESAGPLTVTVTGILSTGETEDDAILAPLSVVQGFAGLEGKVQRVSVSALTIPENNLSRKAQRDPDSLSSSEYDVWYCSAFVSSIAHQLNEALPDASANPVWQVANAEGAIIGKLQVLMLVVTLAAFVSSAMGVSSLINTSVMERAAEIGLLKALGAAKWQILLLFQSEAMLIGLIGGLLGLMLGSGLSQIVGWTVFGSALAFHPIIIPVVLLVSIAIAFVGSIVPSRSIARLMPVEVLYGRK
ncbi:ABC transporter permease [Cohaesibacter marisflavi]|uniref:ABC transporter permease n=1 Tax=Cohaesibacter marisflavi TaxID=655353 RepID=UPI0029C65A19|nr:ABC transporter permease [Cohaesibacter marisflavi]